MASRFWVLDTGTWDASDTTHWSTTSGGLGGASVPGPADTVTFDANSFLLNGTCTVNTNFSITTLSWGTCTGTIDFSVNNNSPTMTTFNGSGISTRSMKLGSGIFSVTGNASANQWQMGTTTGLTWNAGTSTVNFTYSGATGTRTITTGTAALNIVKISAGSDTVALTTTFNAKDLDFTGFTGTQSSSSVSLSGSLTLGIGMTVQASTLAVTFTGTGTITTNGVALAKPVTINASGTITLADALDISTAITNTLTLTAGTLDTASKTVTAGIISGSNSNVRTLTLGSSIVNVVGNNATIFIFATSTNMTLNAGTSTINFTYSGSTGTRTIGFGTTLTYNTVNVTAGTDTVSCTGNGTIFNNFSFAGFTGTNSAFGTTGITGNWTLGTGMTCTSVSNVLTFQATSGTQVFTSNGVQMNRPVTINAVGATVQLADALNIDGATARLLTLTAGTFNDNGKAVTTAQFSSNNSNTRTLTITGAWSITGSGATVWSTSTATGLTVSQSTPIKFTYSGSVGTRTVTPSTTSSSTEANSVSFAITAGSDIVAFSGTSRVWKDSDFTGFTGTWTTAGIEATYGSLTISSGMTVATGGTLTFSATSGTKTLTTNGNSTWTSNIIFNGVGATFQLGDAFTSTGSITLSNGSFSTNNKNLTISSFASSNSNTRSLTLGSSTITLTGTGTIWDITTGTNMTFDAGTSTITANDTTSTTKIFAFNAMTYYNLLLTGAGTGIFQLGVSTLTTTFNNITVSTTPHTVQVFAGKTINLTGTNPLTWSGTVGNLNIFQSTSTGNQWFLTKTSGTIDEDYISLQDSSASGGAQFNAGAHSVDVSNNFGWFFSAEDLPNDASRDQNRVTSLMATSNTDGRTIYKVFADTTTHALSIDDNTTGSDLGPTNAPRDENRVTALMGVSSVDGVTPVVIYLDSTTQKLLVKST